MRPFWIRQARMLWYSSGVHDRDSCGASPGMAAAGQLSGGGISSSAAWESLLRRGPRPNSRLVVA